MLRGRPAHVKAGMVDEVDRGKATQQYAVHKIVRDGLAPIERGSTTTTFFAGRCHNAQRALYRRSRVVVLDGSDLPIGVCELVPVVEDVVGAR